MKLKVVTFVGTRPEIIRLSATIKTLDRFLDHILVHTGQNYDYELSKIFFEELTIPEPNYFLECAGTTVGDTVGNIIARSYSLLKKIQPDAVLILGDTNSCLAAYSAKRLRIPIFHMEAGNRCFDNRVPEEANRRIVDQLSDVNFPYSQIARSYLISEGYNPQQIIVTGSPMREVIAPFLNSIREAKILDELNLKPNNYFLVSCHREENIDNEDGVKKFVHLLYFLAKHYKKPVLVSTHPRTQKQLQKYQEDSQLVDKVYFHKPFGFINYLALQASAKLVLSDSGTITEEADILKFPAVNLRESHERPEGMEKGVVPFLGFDVDLISQYIDTIMRDITKELVLNPSVDDYQDCDVSLKIYQSILSYVKFVNKRLYFK